MRGFALVLALGLAAPFSTMAQEAPAKNPEQGKSQKPLTEEELAEIAGGSGGVQFMIHVIGNPGKADVFQFKKDGSIHCVGVQCSTPDQRGASAFQYIENPSQTITKCNGPAC